MVFGKALEEAKAGAEICRDNWDKEQWIGVHKPDNEEMSLPFLYIHRPSGDQVPWNPEHGELLAENWEVR